MGYARSWDIEGQNEKRRAQARDFATRSSIWAERAALPVSGDAVVADAWPVPVWPAFGYAGTDAEETPAVWVAEPPTRPVPAVCGADVDEAP